MDKAENVRREANAETTKQLEAATTQAEKVLEQALAQASTACEVWRSGACTQNGGRR